MRLCLVTHHDSWDRATSILRRVIPAGESSISASSVRDTIQSLYHIFTGHESDKKFDDIPTMIERLPDNVKSQFLRHTFPQMCSDIATEVATTFKDGTVACLSQQRAGMISFTPREAYLLVASSFLCVPLMSEDGEIPLSHSTCHLFFTNRPRLCAKLHCLVNYFNLMVASHSGAIDAAIASKIIGNNRRIEIERLVSDKTHGAEWWMASTALLQEVDYKPSFQRIESATDAVQADFANKHLGGGVLRKGCVQEEIRFIISPECLLSVFLCEKMASNEAVLIRNTLMFSDYTGYSSSFTCTGFSKPLVSLFEGNSSELILDDIVAIDAIPFGLDKNDQYSLLPIVRELEKCRAGLGYTGKKPFATGNWGCGVFGGDSELKAVIQWLAASASNKSMIYFPFDDPRTARLPELVDLCTRSTNVHVGTIFSALLKGLIDSKIKEGTTIDFLISALSGVEVS